MISYVLTKPLKQEPWTEQQAFLSMSLAMAEYKRLYPDCHAQHMMRIHRHEVTEVFYGDPTDKRVAAAVIADEKTKAKTR